MTDNEIIKALECCCVVGECANCPCYSVKESDCKGIDWSDVYALINRQTEEIKTLTAMVEAAEDYLRPLPFKNAFDEHISKKKAEAIKEFAKRLKECKCSYDLPDYHSFDAVEIEDIDNLVKEMVGTDNG